MAHGDDHGVVLPPKVAPIQVVIIPIQGGDSGATDLQVYVDQIAGDLEKANIRVHVDRREGQSTGRKFNDWEVKGVPLRFEIGPNEKVQKIVTMTKRNTGEKLVFSREDIATETGNQLEAIQNELYQVAQEFLQKNTFEVDNYDKFKEIMAGTRGLIKATWCENATCEAKIKEETKATTRVKPLDAPEVTDGKCIYCGKPANSIWYFGQSY